MIKLTAVTMIMSLAVAQQALAGSVVPAHVGADAKWYGHVDFEAMRDLQPVKDWMGKVAADERHAAKIDEMTQKLGMNPMEDMLGATLYATQYEGDVGILLLNLRKIDQAKVLAEVKEKHPDIKSEEYNGRTLHTWSGKRKSKQMELAGAFAGPQLIVVGSGVADVRAALDVIDGKKPGLKPDSELMKGQTLDVLFSSRALDVPDGYRKVTRCPILRVSRAAEAMWTNDKQGKVTGQYAFVADTPENAASFKAITEGFAAMAMLRYGELPEVKKLTQGLAYKVENSTFTVSWSTTIDEVQAAVDAIKKAGHHMPHKRWHKEGHKAAH